MSTDEPFSIQVDRKTRQLILFDKVFSQKGVRQFSQALTQIMMKQYSDDTPVSDMKERPFIITFCNCPGGDINFMHNFEAFIRIAKIHNPDAWFIARCVGHNASATTILLSSAVFKEVHVDTNATFMIHNMAAITETSAAIIRKKLDLMTGAVIKEEQKAIAHYQRKALSNGKSLTTTEWQKIIDDGDDTPVLSAQQYYDLGLCDKILTDENDSTAPHIVVKDVPVSVSIAADQGQQLKDK